MFYPSLELRLTSISLIVVFGAPDAGGGRDAAPVAQLDVHLTGDQDVAGLTPHQVGNILGD